MNKSRKVVSCLFLLFVILVSLVFSHFTSSKMVESMTNTCSVDTDCESDEKCVDNECVNNASENTTNSNNSMNDASPASSSSNNDNDDKKSDRIKDIKKLQSDKKKLDNKMKKVKDLVCNSKEGFATMNNEYRPEKPSSDGIFKYLFDGKQSCSFSLPNI